MKSSGFLLVASVALLPVRAADATSPIDYRQRNESYAPADSVSAEKKKPQTNGAVQDKRVPTGVVDKAMAPLGDRRASIGVTETREKRIREKDTAGAGTTLEQARGQGSAAAKQQPSAFNHRTAGISTAADTTKPPTVARYQDSLTAASASNMARFPAIDRATTAKINRFVFRKNPSDENSAVNGAAVTPAAGGSSLRK